ncbi:MAG: Endonuclease/exonuclease/phosphatase [Podila humilis]|nr:MAG: Endonuclease/exonuclease/phosphatase [Podila humilis]
MTSNNSHDQLSVLTLNCWLLQIKAKGGRWERLQAICEYILNIPSSSAPVGHHGFDIVGLQEVWMAEDFERIRVLIKKVYPYSRHWVSGLYGCGLAIFSRYPIVQGSLHRYTLNGDPAWCFQGDWYDGKSCSSVVINHPTCGEIQIFNTHMHACYDQPGTRDTYLGTRVSQGWEMAGLVRQAAALGRHVISLGDFNSSPDSLVVKLMTQYGGMTDSWDESHPAPSVMDLKFMTIDEQIAALGITCDTPANTWNEDPWINYLTRSRIGERLDYIFYRSTPALRCKSVQVVLWEPTVNPEPASITAPAKHCSDHFGVHAIFTLKPTSLVPGQRQLWGLEGLQAPKDDIIETLESVLLALKLYHAESSTKSRVCSIYIPVLIALVVLAILIVACLVSLNTWWQSALVLVSVILLSVAWAVSFLYGFIYAGENITKTANLIQEIQTILP